MATISKIAICNPISIRWAIIFPKIIESEDVGVDKILCLITGILSSTRDEEAHVIPLHIMVMLIKPEQ